MQLPNRMYRLSLHCAFAVLVAFLTVRTMRAPISELGDGREYVIQTQAIVFDRQLAIDPVNRAEYWNATNPYGILLNPTPKDPPEEEAVGEARQFGGHFGGLYLAHDGTYRYIHAWVYSLVVAPAYACVHLLAPGATEYLSFRLVNLLFVFVPILLLWRRAPSATNLIFLVVLLASPITPHMQFTNPELFCFFCTLASFIAVASSRWRCWSPILLGIGAAQNIPIILFFPLHLWFVLREENAVTVAGFRRVVLFYCVGAALPVGLLLYNQFFFGTWNLIAALGQASYHYVTFRKVLSVLLSPEIGVFWYLPASWLAIVIGFARNRSLLVSAITISVLAVAALSSSISSINSGQLSASRYAIWFLAPLYVLPFIAAGPSSRNVWARLLWGAVSASLIAIGVIWIHLGTYRFLFGDVFQFYSTQRATPEVAALYRLTHFNDDPEPLVENLTTRELTHPHHFAKLYVWNLGGGESLWIITQRALQSKPILHVTSDSDLSNDTALTNVFRITKESENSFSLYPRDDLQFDRNPYWGGYRLVWAHGTISSINGTRAVYIR